jgi:hypothetical protein
MDKRNYPAEIEEQSIALARICERRDEARERLEETVDDIAREVLAETDETTGKPRHTNDKARELAIRERCRARRRHEQTDTWTVGSSLRANSLRASSQFRLIACASVWSASESGSQRPPDRRSLQRRKRDLPR